MTRILEPSTSQGEDFKREPRQRRTSRGSIPALKYLLPAVAITVLAAAPSLLADDDTGAWPPIRKGTVKWGVAFNAGVAHDLWDGVPDVGFHSIGIRAGRFFGTLGPGPLRGRFALEIELQPVFLMFQETSTYAFSTTLLGSHYFDVDSKVRPFISFGAGIVLSAGGIPTRTSPRINFTPQVGFGIAFADEGGTVYAFEYRLHHMSNWSLDEFNPGINSSFIQFSFSHYLNR